MQLARLSFNWLFIVTLFGATVAYLDGAAPASHSTRKPMLIRTITY